MCLLSFIPYDNPVRCCRQRWMGKEADSERLSGSPKSAQPATETKPVTANVKSWVPKSFHFTASRGQPNLGNPSSPWLLFSSIQIFYDVYKRNSEMSVSHNPSFKNQNKTSIVASLGSRRFYIIPSGVGLFNFLF